MEKKKYGYISIDHVPEGLPGDYTVKSLNGEDLTHLVIQRANDIEGWFEHKVREKTSGGFDFSKIHHVKMDIEIIYKPGIPKDDASAPIEIIPLTKEEELNHLINSLQMDLDKLKNFLFLIGSRTPPIDISELINKSKLIKK